MNDITTGTEAIRAALKQRLFKGHAHPIAQEIGCGVGVGALEAFAHEGRTLAPDVLVALAKYLWGGAAVYDPVADRIRSANQREAVPLGIAPEPVKARPRQPIAQGSLGPQPVKPVPVKPKVKRPGWVD